MQDEESNSYRLWIFFVFDAKKKKLFVLGLS